MPQLVSKATQKLKKIYLIIEQLFTEMEVNNGGYLSNHEATLRRITVLAELIVGSISAALTCLVFPPAGEGLGLISRTAAGNRA